MTKRKALFAALSLVFGLAAVPGQAAEGVAIPDRSWSFDGIFGSYDRAALQRGFQVYREVCSGCHGLKRIAFRNLADLDYNAEEIKSVASAYEVGDGPNDEGEMFTRPGIPADRFPSPFPNDNAARASNGGALPPDLSLITKARMGGADYIHALLTGYVEPPGDFEVLEGLNYNAYFPGHQIAMAQPIYEDSVTYADGTPATVEQMSADVAHFLTWAADPHMEARKTMGLKVMIFLLIMTGIFYASKRKIWADLH